MRGKPWFSTLSEQVRARPIAVLRIGASEWSDLRASRRGAGEFTLVLRRNAVAPLRAPTLCLLVAESGAGDRVLAGRIGNPSAVATMQSRVKLKRIFPVEPSTTEALAKLLPDPVRGSDLRERIGSRESLQVLPTRLGADLVQALAAVGANDVALRSISASLGAPRRVRGNTALQDQSLRTALRAFGLAPDASAVSVELLGEDETAISRVATEDDPLAAVDAAPEVDDLDGEPPRAFVRAVEDGFIEHDARAIAGLDLVGSDATGRAVFARGDERLEVITANRRPLEHALGVDLVYVNTVRHNVVMVQHKMLEPHEGRWSYRPDDQLEDEIARMELFARTGRGETGDYRLHSGVFYLKFVKRDASIRKGGILLPLDHYKAFVGMPASRGPRGGLRVDYDALGGRYLREAAFVDLVRSGYIGAHSDDATWLRTIIRDVLAGGGAVVTAVQSALSPARRRPDAP